MDRDGFAGDDLTSDASDRSLTSAVREWFRPPRAHGEVIDDRAVSPLELLYDLVFVVLISQIAQSLAENVTWRGVADFIVVFGLVWFAWINGSLYHELHGGDDGRSRSYVFAQMLLLVLLAVYAGHAAQDSSDGRVFAVVYSMLLGLLVVQWAGVRRRDTELFAALTTRYITSLGLAGVAVGASALVDDPTTRVWIWAAAVVATGLAMFVAILGRHPAIEEALRVTESMAERLGLFIIIVLGEVVVGVVDGLIDAERDAGTTVTGLLALSIGFGFWWNYFDFSGHHGRRTPRPGPWPRAIWLYAHLPLALATAAAGAGMVGLVEHAGDARTPESTAWLIGGAAAVLAVSLAAVVAVVKTHPAGRLIPLTLSAVAVASLVLAALRPPPWLLALGLQLALVAVWVDAFVQKARTGRPIPEPRTPNPEPRAMQAVR